jgi:hypothetical protein
MRLGAATSVEITWEQRPDCSSGARTRTNVHDGLGSWNVTSLLYPGRSDGRRRHASFFGEGMARVPGSIAADAEQLPILSGRSRTVDRCGEQADLARG